MKKIATILVLLVFAGSLNSQIKYVNHISAKDAGECVVSHNGKFLYLTCFEGLLVYEINQKTGGLTKKQTIKGQDGLEICTPYLSANDNHLYVQAFVKNANVINTTIRVYACNSQTGELKLVSTLDNVNGEKIEHNSNLEVSPQGNFLFLTNDSHQKMYIFKCNATNGSLSHLNTVTSSTVCMYGDIAISPDERFLYIFSQNIYKACFVYELDSRSGSINKIQEVENPNYRDYTSDDFLISPDGKNVYTIGTDGYASNQSQPQIGQYKRDLASGLLTFEHNYNNLQSNGVVDLSFLYMDGSGDNLFATTSYGDELHGVHIFKRNTSDGTITYQKSIVDKAPTDKLRGSFVMDFGKDNRYIYLTASRDHALHILENTNPKSSVSMSETNDNYTPWSNANEDNFEEAGVEIEEEANDDEYFQNQSVEINGSEEDEMTLIHNKLQAESSDTRRLDLSYALLEGKSLKTIQIASMAMLFKSEYKRLEFVKFASYFVSDPQYLIMLEDLFTYDSIRKDFRKHAANLKD